MFDEFKTIKFSCRFEYKSIEIGIKNFTDILLNIQKNNCIKHRISIVKQNRGVAVSYSSNINVSSCNSELCTFNHSTCLTSDSRSMLGKSGKNSFQTHSSSLRSTFDLNLVLEVNKGVSMCVDPCVIGNTSETGAF